MDYVITHPIENGSRNEGDRRIVNRSVWIKDVIDDLYDVYVFDGGFNENRRRSAHTKRVSIKRQQIT
jgi:hypothetical protein